MLVTLELNKDKVKRYNERIAELKRECPEDADDFREINTLADRFIPYERITHDGCIMLEEDYRTDFDGVYVCELNSNYLVENVTNHKQRHDPKSVIYWRNYGVCDNASQALDYYDSLCKEYEDLMRDRLFLILLTPIIKDEQPEHGGWRWHKWGPYIGKFEPKHEYLYDEEGIDYIYCFKILEVGEC